MNKLIQTERMGLEIHQIEIQDQFKQTSKILLIFQSKFKKLKLFHVKSLNLKLNIKKKKTFQKHSANNSMLALFLLKTKIFRVKTPQKKVAVFMLYLKCLKKKRAKKNHLMKIKHILIIYFMTMHKKIQFKGHLLDKALIAIKTIIHKILLINQIRKTKN